MSQSFEMTSVRDQNTSVLVWKFTNCLVGRMVPLKSLKITRDVVGEPFDDFPLQVVLVMGKSYLRWFK